MGKQEIFIEGLWVIHCRLMSPRWDLLNMKILPDRKNFVFLFIIFTHIATRTQNKLENTYNYASKTNIFQKYSDS